MNWITTILIIGLIVNQTHGRRSNNDKSSSSNEKSSGEVKKPYQFGYEIEDGQGNMQHRHEQSDGSGAKVGTYGYVDANGIYRKVEYIADDKGFRVKMSSNEPGMKDHNTPSMSSVTKPYSSNDLESLSTPSTPMGPPHPKPVPAEEEKMYNSLERESTRLSPSKSLDSNENGDYHSRPKLHLVPNKQHDYLYNPRISSSSSSKEIVQQRPSSVYPHSLAITKPSPTPIREIKSSSDSHYSPPLKPSHSSAENNLLSSGEITYLSGQRPVVSPYSYSQVKPMDDKSKESLENNLNSIEQNRNQFSLPYSQYDPMKREKEKALHQQLTKSMKAPYELDNNFRPSSYAVQPSHSYPLPPARKEEPTSSMKADNRFTIPSKWTQHEDNAKRKEIIDKPIFPPPSRYHHEPMSKSLGSIYLRNQPYSGFKEAPSQLPSPPRSPYDYHETTSPTPVPVPPPSSGSYLATELPLPPPPVPSSRSPSNHYDSSHETQLPPPPSSPPPPIHSSIYHVDEPSSHEIPNSHERPPHFSSSLPPFEPSRLKSESYSDMLPLPPPTSSSSSSHPPPPPPHHPMHQSDYHNGPPRKRPAAYPPRPETKDYHEPESNLPQVIYDSRESGSSEHGGRSSSAERNYPIDRSSDNNNHQDNDWYSVDGDSRHPSPRQQQTPPPPPYTNGDNKFNPRDESVYINKLPYDPMETKPPYPIANDFGRINNVPTINARYPRHKLSQDEPSTINNKKEKEKQLRGTSSEIYSNFKIGLKDLLNQNSRDKKISPITKKTQEQSTNYLNNQHQSTSDIIKSPKQLVLTASSSSSEDTKLNAPVYRD